MEKTEKSALKECVYVLYFFLLLKAQTTVIFYQP